MTDNIKNNLDNHFSYLDVEEKIELSHANILYIKYLQENLKDRLEASNANNPVHWKNIESDFYRLASAVNRQKKFNEVLEIDWGQL